MAIHAEYDSVHTALINVKNALKKLDAEFLLGLYKSNLEKFYESREALVKEFNALNWRFNEVKGEY